MRRRGWRQRSLWAAAVLALIVACSPSQGPAGGGESLPVVPQAPATAAAEAVSEPTRRAENVRISDLDVSSLRSGAVHPGDAPLEIRYALDAPARVRLRLVDKDSPGLILRTLLDWAPCAAGPQVEVWDGLDAQGEPVNPRQVSVALAAEPDPGMAALWDWEALQAGRYPEHKHWLHERDVCSDLEVHLTAPADGARLEGVVEVCAGLGESRGMPDGEYHVAIYLEGRTAWDGRMPATGPFCQLWDTRNVPDGAYRLAITFNDLRDHSGSDWISVIVENGG